MTISMLPRESIVKNPENRIYVIGDVSLLREDIAANGIRQPLEVIPAADGKYLLIGGERRLTACDELAAQGDRRFDRLPCIIRASQGAAEDRIALITANAGCQFRPAAWPACKVSNARPFRCGPRRAV